MKPTLVAVIAIYIGAQTMGCKKENVDPPNPVETIETVIDTSGEYEITIYPGGLILTNTTWITPWYNSIEISEISKLVSSPAYKVFIQRQNSPAWIEVPVFDEDGNTTSAYEYIVEKRPDGAGIYNPGSLYIFYYGMDISDKPAVKIEY